MKDKNFFARLYYYFKKNDKNAHIDESDALIGSIAILLLAFGFVTFLNSMYNSYFAKYLEMPNILFFGVSIFSLYFLIIMKLERGSRKSFFLVCTFPFIALCIFLSYLFNFNLSEANNGLSLIALGLTLLFMPMDKIEEDYQKAIKEIEEDSFAQKQKIKDETIEFLKESNSNLLEIIDDLLIKQKGYSDRIDKSVDDLKLIEQSIETMKQELDNFKE